MNRVVEILAGVVSTRLESKEIGSFDFNDSEERQEYEKFLEKIKETYKEIARSESDGSWGYSKVAIFENTAPHSPSEKEPTYYLVEEWANDTGDWGAVIYAIF